MSSIRMTTWAICIPLSGVLFETVHAVPQAPALQILPGTPPVVDPHNLYSESTAGKLSAAVAGALPRVYVPDVKSGDVYVIDPCVSPKLNLGM